MFTVQVTGEGWGRSACPRGLTLLLSLPDPIPLACRRWGRLCSPAVGIRLLPLCSPGPGRRATAPRRVPVARASLGPKEETSARRGRRSGRPRPTGISGCSVLVGVAQRPVAHRAQRSAQRRVFPGCTCCWSPPALPPASTIEVARARRSAKPSTMVPPRASRSYKPVQGSTQWVAVTIWYQNIVCQNSPVAPPRNDFLVLHGVVALLMISAGFSRASPSNALAGCTNRAH